MTVHPPDHALLQQAYDWFESRGWSPFPFQLEAWEAYLDGQSGLVNAPTGSGKTYSLLMGILLEHLRAETRGEKRKGLQAIWITPIRALAKEIEQSAARAISGLGLDWQVGIRTGDTKSAERARQKRSMPQLLITTPESLHLLLAQKQYPKTFQHLQTIVVDEWHELLGSKRAVQMELALSRLRAIQPGLRTWGISATVGNMEEAIAVLMGEGQAHKARLIRAQIEKQIVVATILPDEIEQFPWSGHLGLKMLEKVVPILQKSRSTLIFTNTRAQCEIWYQRLMEAAPELAGLVGMHHGSMSKEVRHWVEDALHSEQIKAVVCTSSLDLGVDFRPVETIVQIGSPKGVARFMQRAGRSGHQPGAVSRIYFVPTHSLELIEAAALREAISRGKIEARIPYLRSFDVLVQYLVTLAVSEGFDPREIYREVTQTCSFASITPDEWAWCLRFITTGGGSLGQYDEFRKVEVIQNQYVVKSRAVARRHRMSIGTIVSDAMLRVRFVNAGVLGHVEEWFVSRLKPGDNFWFAGRSLELVRIKDMEVQVKKSNKTTGPVPSFMGGRLPLSSQMGQMLREMLERCRQGDESHPELPAIRPLIELQQARSIVPSQDELLIEQTQSREGHHLFIYPFEGRAVHEGLSALIAHRIAQQQPISFSIAMNDYGFELLSEQPVQMGDPDSLLQTWFSTEELLTDIQASVNNVEMARRQFRDIASIAGLVFTGWPGEKKKDRHLQASSQLFFQVFAQHEPDNLLLRQAYEEVLTFQLEEARLRQALHRIHQQQIRVITTERPTPFAFPILVDRLREKLSSEKLEDRVRRMQVEFAKAGS